jgi:hypothetical protein
VERAQAGAPQARSAHAGCERRGAERLHAAPGGYGKASHRPLQRLVAGGARTPGGGEGRRAMLSVESEVWEREVLDIVCFVSVML